MEDKQKEIQKMQQEIFDSCAWRFSTHPEDYREVANDIGEDLYNLGYRNCKDKVVLTREEYEMLVNQYKTLEIKYSNLCDNYRLCKDANETLKQNVIIARKETAREFAKLVYSTLTNKTVWCAMRNWWLENEECYPLKDLLYELAKQYGVIGEENV